MTNSIDTWKAAVTANGVLRRAFFFFQLSNGNGTMITE